MTHDHVYEGYVPGLWRGSIYGPTGRRSDIVLELRADGHFKQATFQNGAIIEKLTGLWRYSAEARLVREPGDEPGILYLDSEKADVRRHSVLTISNCEDSNCMLILRRVILASRNLPTVYYRSHEDPMDCWQKIEQLRTSI